MTNLATMRVLIGVLALMPLHIQGQSRRPATTTSKPTAAPVSDVDTVIELFKSEVSESVIIKQLQSANKPMTLAPADLLKLQKAHVPERVIEVMLDPKSAPPVQPAAVATLEPRTEVEPVPVVALAAVEPQPAPEPQRVRVELSPAPIAETRTQPREFILVTGTRLAVLTIDKIDSTQASLEKEYTASLESPVVVDDVQIVPAKATAFLRVVKVKQAGAIKGKASLSIRLVGLTINDRRVSIETADAVVESGSKGKKTAVMAGTGAATGAAIGAIFGGGAGAAIGAGAGGGAGTIVAIFAGEKVKVAPETRLTFELTHRLLIPAPK